MRRVGEQHGEAVHQIDIDGGGLSASLLSWGAALRDLRLRDDERRRPLVLGFERLQDYLDHSPHFGATAGRFANRIAGGRFDLDGVAYRLDRNQHGVHHLHGGAGGFGKRPWRAVAHDDASVTFELISDDGDQGYPGRLTARCVYRLLAPATLQIELSAVSDAATVVNLAHHSYFNLDGGDDILDHRLRLAADAYTPVDDELIPTGELRAVAGSCYDFRDPRPLRWVDDAGDPVHYDTNFVLAENARDEPRFAARLDGETGISMEVWTTEPGLQLYTGAKLAVPVAGLDGRRYGASAGVCFEPQRFPDAPNQPAFPNAELRPGERYRQLSEYRFSIS